MRKWLYVVSIIVIAGLLSVSYYVTGVRAEKEFDRFLVSANSVPNLHVTADHYKRGWLKSTVDIHAVFHRPEQQYTQNGVLETLPAQDVSFSFPTTLYHGPIIIANNRVMLGLGYARAEVPLPKEALNQFNNVFTQNSTKPNFIVAFLLKYRNRLNVDFNIPPFKLFAKNGLAYLDWKGLDSHWKLASKKLIHTKGYIKFEGLTFKNGDTNGEVGGMRIKYDVENTTSQILSGEASVDLKTFQLIADHDLPVVVDGFQTVFKSHVNDNLLSSSLEADLSRITFRGLDYGPGVLSVVLRNLDATSFNQIQQQLQAAGNSNLTDAQQQVLILTLLPELPVLLGKGAEFEIKQFQLAIPQGLILATAKIKLSKQKNANQNSLQLINQLQATAQAEVPVSWLNDMVTDLLRFKIQQHQIMQQQLDADKATHSDDATKVKKSESVSIEKPKLLSSEEIDLVAKQQMAEQLGNLVQNGLLIQKNNIYSIKIVFKNGAFVVNGKPFNGNVIQ